MKTEIINMPDIFVIEINKDLTLEGVSKNDIKVSFPFINWVPNGSKNGSYDLVACIEHVGDTFSSGHYISNVLDINSKEWYKIDNDFVEHIKRTTGIDKYQVKSLFYKKRNSTESQKKKCIVKWEKNLKK